MLFFEKGNPVVPPQSLDRGLGMVLKHMVLFYPFLLAPSETLVSVMLQKFTCVFFSKLLFVLFLLDILCGQKDATWNHGVHANTISKAFWRRWLGPRWLLPAVAASLTSRGNSLHLNSFKYKKRIRRRKTIRSSPSVRQPPSLLEYTYSLPSNCCNWALLAPFLSK